MRCIEIVGQDQRQSEGLEQTGAGGFEEQGQPGDPVLLKRERVDAMRFPLRARSGAFISRERRLPVGGRRHQAKAAAEFPGPRGDGADRVASRVPLRPRRHGEGRILLEQRDEAIEIVALAQDGFEEAASLVRVGARERADALEMAIWARRDEDLDGLVHHSDRGVQYTSIRYAERLAGEKAVRSVGSKGDSYDNAAAEALNSLYKRELIDPRKDWQGVDDVMLATMDWVQWYNEDRIHSYSGDMPPRKYEEIYYQALESGKLTSSSQI